MGQLQVFQNKAAKVQLNLPLVRRSSTEALDRHRRHVHRCVMMQKYLSGEIDLKLDIRRNSSFHSYQTRRSNDLLLPRLRTIWGKQTFIFQAYKDWNIDNDINPLAAEFSQKCRFFGPLNQFFFLAVMPLNWR